MGAPVFLVALVLGAGALALWVDARFPRLAPEGFRSRSIAAGVAALLVFGLPVAPSAAGMLVLLLPALVFAFLTAVWLLRVAADPAAHV